MKYALLICAVVLSCRFKQPYTQDTANRHDRWLAHFEANERDFGELVSYIEQKFLTSGDYSRRNSIYLLNCSARQRVADYQICDERAVEMMTELNVVSVAVEKDSGCPELQAFDSMYVTIGQTSNPVVIFIYDYCGTKQYYENSNIIFWPINDHWGIQFEN